MTGHITFAFVVFHSLQAKTTKKIVLRMECTTCRKRKQITLKRCKHFELGGDKKRKVGLRLCLCWCPEALKPRAKIFKFVARGRLLLFPDHFCRTGE